MLRMRINEFNLLSSRQRNEAQLGRINLLAGNVQFEYSRVAGRKTLEPCGSR